MLELILYLMPWSLISVSSIFPIIFISENHRCLKGFQINPYFLIVEYR